MKSITVTRDGKTYDIPELWIAGYVKTWSGCLSVGYAVAVDLWIEQEEMSQRLEEMI